MENVKHIWIQMWKCLQSRLNDEDTLSAEIQVSGHLHFELCLKTTDTAETITTKTTDTISFIRQSIPFSAQKVWFGN